MILVNQKKTSQRLKVQRPKNSTAIYLPVLPRSVEDKLEQIIIKLLEDQYFKPIIDSIPFLNDEMVFQNSDSALIDAIRSNKIIFSQGRFKGDFNAKLTRELKLLGARWDSTQGSWRILLDSLPNNIQMAIRSSNASYLSMTSKIQSQLDLITPDTIDFGETIKSFFATQVMTLDEEVTNVVVPKEKNLPTDLGYTTQRRIKSPAAKRRALDKISVSQQMTPEQIQKLADGYTNTIELAIKNFTQEQTVNLRQRISLNVNSGNRYENIITDIQHVYSVSQSKAKFLARQETNLMTAQIHQMKSESAGSKGYVWVCVKGSPNHPVRPAHKVLDGTYHTWDNPPVVNPKTGMKAHPGQDYNCRCRPRVVFGDYEKSK